ncbi:hypothetical protein BHE74_00009388 [Ensete ventricosum]|nr:hypothetical protein BHE74_00009388 [Ensete ventricosum]
MRYGLPADGPRQRTQGMSETNEHRPRLLPYPLKRRPGGTRSKEQFYWASLRRAGNTVAHRTIPRNVVYRGRPVDDVSYSVDCDELRRPFHLVPLHTFICNHTVATAHPASFGVFAILVVVSQS